jgi:uncharacterized protein (DUF305 family)
MIPPHVVTTPGHTNNVMMSEVHEMMSEMDTMDMSGDPDTHFAKMMKGHHQGAIEMAQIEIAQGTDASIKTMAQTMLNAQTQEISDLNMFLADHIPHAENDEFNMEMEHSMMKMHNNIDLQAVNGNIDHDFALLMIFHHQSAIEMADIVLHYGHEPEIADMAQMMKEDQEMEIEQLQNWLLGQ